MGKKNRNKKKQNAVPTTNTGVQPTTVITQPSIPKGDATTFEYKFHQGGASSDQDIVSNVKLFPDKTFWIHDTYFYYYDYAAYGTDTEQIQDKRGIWKLAKHEDTCSIISLQVTENLYKYWSADSTFTNISEIPFTNKPLESYQIRVSPSLKEPKTLQFVNRDDAIYEVQTVADLPYFDLTIERNDKVYDVLLATDK
jgi:hypothetical protein